MCLEDKLPIANETLRKIIGCGEWGPREFPSTPEEVFQLLIGARPALEDSLAAVINQELLKFVAGSGPARRKSGFPGDHRERCRKAEDAFRYVTRDTDEFHGYEALALALAMVVGFPNPWLERGSLKPSRYWVVACLRKILSQSQTQTPPPPRQETPMSPELQRMCEHLSAPVQAPAIEENEVLKENIDQILLGCLRKRRRAIVLLAPPGGGKTFTVQQLGLRVGAKHQSIPSDFHSYRVFRARPSAILDNQIGGTAKNLEELFSSLGSAPTNAEGSRLEQVGAVERSILFFDEFHFLIHPEPFANAEIKTSFKELLTSDKYPRLTVITASTKREFDLFVRSDPALERRLTPIHLRLPTRDLEKQILIRRLEGADGVDLPESRTSADSLVSLVIDLAEKRLSSRPRLDTALDILDGALARRVFSDGAGGLRDLVREEAHSQVARTLPISLSPDAVEEIKTRLRNEVIGQAHVTDGLVDMAFRISLGLRSMDGPEAVVLLTGRAGIGKRSLCRTLAEVLGGKAVLEIRLQEFGEDASEAIRRLIGTQASYKRSEGGGMLVNFVRDHPDGLMIFTGFDGEREQNRGLYEFLSAVVRAGVVQDGFGNTLSLRNNSVIFCVDLHEVERTSQGESETESSRATFTSLEQNPHSLRCKIIEEARKQGLPEEIGPLVRDAFHLEPYSPGDLAEFALREVKLKKPRVEEALGIRFKVDEEVGDVLVLAAGKVSDRSDSTGTVSVWDLRHLREFIDQGLWPPLAAKLGRVVERVKSEEPLKEAVTVRLSANLPEQMAGKINVLLLDDQAPAEVESLKSDIVNCLVGYSSLFSFTGYPKSELDSANAEALLRSQAFWQHVQDSDAILLDLNWGWGRDRREGLEILSAIRGRFPDSGDKPVIFYTSEPASHLRFDYWKKGASGFVMKGEEEQLEDSLMATRRSILLERAVRAYERRTLTIESTVASAEDSNERKNDVVLELEVSDLGYDTDDPHEEGPRTESIGHWVHHALRQWSLAHDHPTLNQAFSRLSSLLPPSVQVQNTLGLLREAASEATDTQPLSAEQSASLYNSLANSGLGKLAQASTDLILGQWCTMEIAGRPVFLVLPPGRFSSALIAALELFSESGTQEVGEIPGTVNAEATDPPVVLLTTKQVQEDLNAIGPLAGCRVQVLDERGNLKLVQLLGEVAS